jgi:hypothetical protein
LIPDQDNLCLPLPLTSRHIESAESYLQGLHALYDHHIALCEKLEKHAHTSTAYQKNIHILCSSIYDMYTCDHHSALSYYIQDIEESIITQLNEHDKTLAPYRHKNKDADEICRKMNVFCNKLLILVKHIRSYSKESEKI